MFSYLKYFAIVSFVLLVAITLGAVVYSRSVLTGNVIMGLAEQSNISFGKGFSNALAGKYFGPGNPLDLAHPELFAASPDFAVFTREFSKYAESLPLARAALFLPDGRKIAERAKERFPPEDSRKWLDDFAVSGNGRVVSAIIGDAWDTGGGDIFVRSFVPVYIGGAMKPQLLAELVYDVSPSWRDPLKLQVYGTGIILAVFVVLYAALFLSINRAEKIITTQHEANLELAEAKIRAEAESQEKSKFLANISHELRTPLNAIIGFSEIIKDEVMGPLGNQQYKEYTSDIYASGVHLLSLINDILDYSKAEAGKLEIDLVEVDVTKIMKSSLRLVSPRAEESGVALIDNVPEDHFVVRTDPKRLKQIILNLLSNSVKFTPAGGKVTLYSWYNVQSDTLIIEVKDTGIGIAPKDISKVMSTFGQLENEYNRKYEGTGLGLPLSKKLIELMGGRFKIESQVNQGTVVTISIPKEGRGGQHAA